MAKRPTILLTGGTGFLGRAILPRLIKAGFEVIVLVRSVSSLEKIKPWKKFVRTCEEKDLPKLFSQGSVQGVMHVATSYGRAGEKFSDVAKANLVLPLTLLELGVEYGLEFFINADTFFTTELGLAPKEKSYITTKKLFLKTAEEIVRGSATKFFNLRIEQMYGPGDDGKKFVMTMVRHLLDAEPSIELTAGQQRRDFVYVDDVAEAFVKTALRAGKLGQYLEFGIGSGRAVSIKKAVTILKKITGSKSTLLWGNLPYRSHEIMHSSARIKNNTRIGWRAKTSLELGLQKTVVQAKKDL